MWPYTNDEAGWLSPPDETERKSRGSANDNDPARHVPPRLAPAQPPHDRKSLDET
jgi:hypothetical protein